MLTEVAGYHLVEPIAKGAYGTVFRAIAPKGQTVALKLLTADGTTSHEAIARFQREAQATMSLDHLNIVKVIDAGFAVRRHFLVMEFIEGESLRSLLEKHVDVRRVVQILRDVARALAHAHDKGVIHRDLKPENILLTPDGVPKITDFGIARLSRMAASRLTAIGIALGTPEYMSPEQAAGRSRDADERSDIYTLGVILYEAVTGRLPFEARAVVELLRKIEREPPQAPSAITSTVDKRLEHIILKTLAKMPEARYRTARALADDLEGWLKGKPLL